MTTVSFEVPDEALQALHATPDQLTHAVRLAAASFWYGRGEITLGTAAAFAGMGQAEFMRVLKESEQDTFAVDLDDLDRELAFLQKRRSGPIE